jgi:hypothetical protein
MNDLSSHRRATKRLTGLMCRTSPSIKIDVEGAEMEVFDDLSKSLDTHRPLIVCTILRVKNEDAAIQAMRRERSNAVQSLLKH